MLAPDDIDPIIDALNGFHANLRAADALTSVFKTLTFYPTTNEAQWITKFRNHRIPVMRQTGTVWQSKKMIVLPDVLGAIPSYRTRFQNVARHLPTVEDGETAAFLLDRLISQMEKNSREITHAKNEFNEWVREAEGHVSHLDEAITVAWGSLGGAERKIVVLTERITEIKDEISALSGVISLENISEGVIGGAKDVLLGLATITYAVAIDGLTLPILGVGKTFFSLGMMFYDIFSSAGHIKTKLQDLGKYRLDMTLEQLSLAQIKSALMQIYEIRTMVAKQGNTLREIEAFWQSELRNVRTVRDNFSRNFEKNNSEIVQLPIANGVWETLNEYAQDISESFNRGVDTGPDINFTV